MNSKSVQVITGVPGCILIPDVLTQTECEELIKASEAIGYAYKKSSRSGPAIRDNERALYFANDERTNTIQNRIRYALEKMDTSHMGPGWKLKKDGFLNNKWRFNLYQGDQQFYPHFDSGYEFSLSSRSLFSFIIYLNDDFSGGETVFFPDGQTRDNMLKSHKNAQEVVVKPKAGSAIVFPQYGPFNPRHSGKPVQGPTRGKYIVRTDIIFENEVLNLSRLMFTPGNLLRKVTFILGPSGSGKTTQALNLARKTNATVICFGDCLRQEGTSDTELGKKIREFRKLKSLWQDQDFGAASAARRPRNWMSDEICIQILEKYLANAKENVIIEGFPKIRSQSLFFETSRWFIVAAIHINISPKVQEARLLSRQQERPKDSLESIAAKRIDWESDTLPLIEQYKKRNQLIEVNGERDPEIVTEEIETALQFRYFQILIDNLPDNVTDLLKDLACSKINIGRSTRVYYFHSNSKRLFLKVASTQVGNRKTTNVNGFHKEIYFLKSELRKTFPLQLPEVELDFKIENDIFGMLSTHAPGVSLKKVLKKNRDRDDVIEKLAASWIDTLKKIHDHRPSPHIEIPKQSISDLLDLAEKKISNNLINLDFYKSKYGVDGDFNLQKELNSLRRDFGKFNFDHSVLLHGDPCAPNLFLDEQELKIVSCIDMGYLGFGDPYWDLALANWSFAHNVKGREKNSFADLYFGKMLDSDKLDWMYRLLRFLL